MTFLNPMMLWGLAAVSIPILIHIFNLRRTKKIEFSTLMFLKEIQQSKYKKIKLKQLLILLCRILMIIFLVMAFAQPFEPGYLGKPGEKVPSSVLILLDDSFSMQARDQQGQYFETAKKKAVELLDLLSDEDEIYFAAISGIGQDNIKPYLGNREALKDSVKNAGISYIRKTLNEVISWGAYIAESFSKANKEIYLITDAQRTFVTGAPLESSFRVSDQIHFSVIDIGNRTGNNISLDTVNVITKIFERNKDVRVKCVVTNRNNFNVSGKSVLLSFGNHREEKIVDIPSNSSVDVEFKFRPEINGFQGGVVEIAQNEISDDEIGRDNKRYFAFYVPEKVRVLLLSPAPADGEFLKLALDSYEDVIRGDEAGNARFFNIKEVSEIISENLSTYDVVVILNETRLTDSESERIKEYLMNGGGVIIFPGSKQDPGDYNRFLYKLELPQITGTFGDVSGEQIYKFDRIDFEHPVFEGIYKEITDTRKNLLQESPGIKFGWNLISQKNSVPVIVLNNERNFLVEYSFGTGKILLYAVPPDMSWSDFAAASLFSPLMVRSILYPANRIGIKEAVVGKDYFLDVAALDVHMDSLIVGGKGFDVRRREILNLRSVLNQVSNYIVEAGNKTVYEFPCGFDKRESDLEKMPARELKEYLENSLKVPVNVIEADKELTTSLIGLRSGKDLWQYFLILTLVCVAAEYYLAKSLMK